MTAERRVVEQLSDYYEPVVGFEDISGIQAQFSTDVAQRLSELNLDKTSVVIPLIGGMYQWWRLQDTAPELVSRLQPYAVFVARDSVGGLHFSNNSLMQHVVVLDDIADRLGQFEEICRLPEIQCAESMHFFTPTRKIHTESRMQEFSHVDFFIPHCFPNDENGNPIWVCSGFGMNEGPNVNELRQENFRGSLASLAANQRMSTVCYKRKPTVVPRYSMEIQLFGLATGQGSLRERNRLIDLETYKGNWQRQFHMVESWPSE